MKDIYFISGMGANTKVFENIKLEKHRLHFIEWISPEKNESLENYSYRLSKGIKAKSPVIIGLSFGGIVAQEISNIIECEKIIIIASVKKRSELPLFYRITSVLSLHKLIPSVLFNNAAFLARILFGRNSKKVLNSMEKYFTMRDIKYSRWAIDKVVNWKEKGNSTPLLHIHGNRDSVFPARNIEGAEIIDRGTHMMVFNKAKAISQLIEKFIADNEIKQD